MELQYKKRPVGRPKSDPTTTISFRVKVEYVDILKSIIKNKIKELNNESRRHSKT